MQHDLTYIAEFIANNFLHIWPYLLFSIPLAVLVRVTNAKQYIRRAFAYSPLVSILLATLVGAFSPFCSCSVIPLIASLLIAGVPLGPVMSFWIASPTMDPEIFLLSVSVLGWPLAVARVVATLILSLSAGLIAHRLAERGFFVEGILREERGAPSWTWRRLGRGLVTWMMPFFRRPAPQPALSGPVLVSVQSIDVRAGGQLPVPAGSSCGVPAAGSSSSCGCGEPAPATESGCSSTDASTCGTSQSASSNWGVIRREAWDATLMIVRFMLLAFLLEALINLYVPQDAIVELVGTGNPVAILFAALVGVPVYTSNLAAMPLVGGLLSQGMLPGAALAFLIAGPATTIPAMSAVYGIAKPRVFAVYVSITLVGAVVLGYAYQLALSWG